ncbi:hypothetical protein [Halorientalis litorea]|uniref:hypothetical protein n=1 Tax=Halorientalis litorea TaxID=2931977 RepID=UPI001FF22D5F|nr:hypothetical protein [Halorientalis litorea]
MIPLCDTPGQSAVAAAVGGLLGGGLAVTFGLGVTVAVLLAGFLAGAGDILAHVLRGDAQFRAAVTRVRRAVGRRGEPP